MIIEFIVALIVGGGIIAFSIIQVFKHKLKSERRKYDKEGDKSDPGRSEFPRGSEGNFEFRRDKPSYIREYLSKGTDESKGRELLQDVPISESSENSNSIGNQLDISKGDSSNSSRLALRGKRGRNSRGLKSLFKRNRKVKKEIK